MKTGEEIIDVLAQQKPWLLEIYQVDRLGIFGSYAKGQQTETSDLDIWWIMCSPHTVDISGAEGVLKSTRCA